MEFGGRGSPAGRGGRSDGGDETVLSLPGPGDSVYSGTVADDSAGKPFGQGEEPEDRDHGAAGEASGSVVFDEAFVRAAVFHEPTAAERTMAAAQRAAESEQAAEEAYSSGGWGPESGEPAYGGFEVEGYASFRDEDDYREYEAYQEFCDSEDTPGYRSGGQGRWHRPVAWLLALVMGVGVVAMAFAALRGGSGEREEPTPPPATTGLDSGVGSTGPRYAVALLSPGGPG